MHGIYIHIPFCRRACHYCNFHFSVSLKQQRNFVDCLLEEIRMQADFFRQPPGKKSVVDTLYLGGGTPSVLEREELMAIFDAIHLHFNLSEGAEITLEANPDDLDEAFLLMLKQTPVNRLSIGIQSFHGIDLRYMNRLHTAEQALRALEMSLSAGFVNLNADLIYATPTMTDAMWIENLKRMTSLGIPHISAYALTVEKKTALDVMIRKGQMKAVDEEQAARQFGMMVEFLSGAGYQHYEISNFALPGQFSRHNLSYWTGAHYLGLGPSAHSYRDGQRWWNVANTTKYIKSLQGGVIPAEGEVLTPDQQYDEYIMTSLRTMWGCDLDHVVRQWGAERCKQLLADADMFIRQGKMVHTGNRLLLTDSGKLFADGIAAELFLV